ncbi:hypothetical protein ACKGJO_05750 [Gracilimonas sp. Q87]|uniref:hypothetical protein n=1 Tax=Gracilimonas sp. Q87 TaxID=3384766 RepID=UPI00398407B4
MKVFKNTLTLFALLAVFSTASFAQGPANATVDATADVLSALNIDFGGESLVFGELSQGDYTTIISANSSHNGGADQNPGTGASTAVGTISGSAGARILVSYNTGVTMTNSADNTQSIAVKPVIYLVNNDTPANQLIANAGTSTLIDSDTVSDITVGGEITLTSGTPTGSYSTANGSGVALQITVDYN